MRQWLALLLAVGSATLLISLLAGGEAGGITFGLLTLLFPVGLMAFGALGRRGLGPVAGILIALSALLQVGFWGLLGLRGRIADGPWIGGMPAAVWVMLGCLWLLPLLLVGLGYALTFGHHGASEAELERLRQARRADAAEEGS